MKSQIEAAMRPVWLFLPLCLGLALPAMASDGFPAISGDICPEAPADAYVGFRGEAACTTPLSCSVTAPGSACGGEKVEYHATCSGPAGTYPSYAWDFGDGGFNSGKDTFHYYAAVGTFHWKMTAYVDGNVCGTAEGDIAITLPQLTCTATAPATAELYTEVQFHGTVTPSCPIEIYFGTWEFQDVNGTVTKYGEYAVYTWYQRGDWPWSFHGETGNPVAICATKSGTIHVGASLKVGNVTFTADTISQTEAGTYRMTGNVTANGMLYFTGETTYTGTPSSGTGTVTTAGDIFVKLQAKNQTLLQGPGLAFDLNGDASSFLPRFSDPNVTYVDSLAGVPLVVNGLPIVLDPGGVKTESTFYVGVLNVFTLVQAKAVMLYPPGGKQTLVEAKVVNGEVVPSVKFLDMSLTYDPDQKKLEGKMSVGFPFIKDMWSIDLAVRVVQGCFNGLDLTLPLAAGIPLGTTGLEIANLTVKMDNICVGQFTIFLGGDLNQLVPPIPAEFFQIKDAGVQYYYPLSLEVKGGTMTILGYPMQETSGRVNLNSFSGTFKTRGNILDVLQGEIRFDLIIPKTWFMGRYNGKLQIPDFQCAWTSVVCRAMRVLIRSAVTLPYVINEQSLEFNAQYKAGGGSFGFFRGMINIPVVGSAAILVETEPGQLHLLVGTNFENLFEVTESCPVRDLGPESAEQVLVVGQTKDSVVFSAAADSVLPSIYLKIPAGDTITPSNAATFPGVTYASDESEKVALFRVANAQAGTWTLGADNLSANQVTFLALAPKPAPATSFTSVTKNGFSVSIAAAVTPAASQTKVSLLYSSSNDGSVEGFIAQDLPATTGGIFAVWDMSTLPTGTYYILASTDDGMNPPVSLVYGSPVSTDQGILLPPSGLTGTRNGTSASLSWTPSASPSVVGHTVMYTDDLATAGYPYTAIPARDDGTNLEGLDPEKGYRFCIVAYDEQPNLSPQSNVLTFPKPGGIPGDCDGDATVSIGEVQKAINMFLGTLAPDCGVDCNGDGVVSIGEVQKVINGFLGNLSSC